MQGQLGKLLQTTDSSLSDMEITATQKEISVICDNVKNLLLSKNKKYGDSALNPARVFSKANATEQILVRIDDKLSRIARGVGLFANDEDVINDLIGYLVLLKISLKREAGQAWDGTDIDSFAKTPNHWDSSVLPGSDGQDLLELHKSGDKFA
jgi:hypothetical protein